MLEDKTMSAKWKLRYQIFWDNTPKSKRKNARQIENIIWQAKLYSSLFE